MSSSWTTRGTKTLFAWAGFSLAGSCLLYWSYGDCLWAFFHFDDFWILGRVAQIRVETIADLKEVFVPVHGFLLYRPLSTVGYFLLLREIFGNDPFWYHLTQMALQVLAAMLSAVLFRRILRSAPAGWALGLAYLTTPGLGIATCWPALCTVTAPTLLGLLAILSWLGGQRVTRVVLTSLWFALALASSEHGVVIPFVLLLASMFLVGAPRGLGHLAVLVLLSSVSAGYALAKLWYMRHGLVMDFPDPMTRAVFLSGYRLDWNPLVFFRSLGTYAFWAFGPFWRFHTPDEGVKVVLGVALVLALLITVAANRYVRDDFHRRLTGAASFGLAWFLVSLLPVAFLPGRTGSYYVSFGAPGLLLWFVSNLSSLTRVGVTRVALAVLTVLLVFHALQRRDLLDSEEQRFFRNFTDAAERWTRSLADLQRLPWVHEIVVPDSILAQLVFSQGRVAETLLCSDVRVTVAPNIEQVPPLPGRIILPEPFRYPQNHRTRAAWLPKRCP